jgi:hypothetical protein
VEEITMGKCKVSGTAVAMLTVAGGLVVALSVPTPPTFAQGAVMPSDLTGQKSKETVKPDPKKRQIPRKRKGVPVR